jgi:hypothetical protein
LLAVDTPGRYVYIYTITTGANFSHPKSKFSIDLQKKEAKNRPLRALLRMHISRGRSLWNRESATRGRMPAQTQDAHNNPAHEENNSQ